MAHRTCQSLLTLVQSLIVSRLGLKTNSQTNRLLLGRGHVSMRQIRGESCHGLNSEQELMGKTFAMPFVLAEFFCWGS